jgi:regulator of cell morphogenesis and NO signaling
METWKNQSLAAIVLENHEFIPILEKYNLDFCCRGKTILSEACIQKNINPDKVIEEMKKAGNALKPILPFAEMTAEQLINYLIIHHHFYVRKAIPAITGYLNKLVSKHGDRYPYLKKIDQLFASVKNELEPHMQKEEQVLFPMIKEVVAAQLQKKDSHYSAADINATMRQMEAEHDNAGQSMFEIRRITNNYTAPGNACNTHRVCLAELMVFESDLHQHVHLENNILFPMAVELTKEIAMYQSSGGITNSPFSS